MTWIQKKREKGPEAYAQDAILGLLVAMRIVAFRMQVGSAMFTDASGRPRRVQFGIAGMADILAFPKVYGRPCPLWIECKSDVGRQSALQKSFADQVEQDGHGYIVARSTDDVLEALKGLPK